MHLQKILLALLLLLAGGKPGYAQQPVTDEARFLGEWQITKIETQLFAQQDGRLLEAKTITHPDSMNRVPGFIPLNIVFQQQDCMIKHSWGIEGARYLLNKPGTLLYQRKGMQVIGVAGEGQPMGIPFSYKFPEPAVLVLQPLASFYKDSQRNMAVKMVCICHYRKVVK